MFPAQAVAPLITAARLLEMAAMAATAEDGMTAGTAAQTSRIHITGVDTTAATTGTPIHPTGLQTGMMRVAIGETIRKIIRIGTTTDITMDSPRIRAEIIRWDLRMTASSSDITTSACTPAPAAHQATVAGNC